MGLLRKTKKKCQKTLFQQIHNQYNFILKMHLMVPLDILCFTFFIYGPIFLQNYFLSGIFIKFWPKMHFVAYFWPFSADFRASPRIFKYSGFSNPITCIHFLKALDVSFHLSYNSSIYHKNCGVNNFFYPHLALERHQDLRTLPRYN